MKAWHFTNGNKLRDGSPLPADGELLKHEEDVAICESGLHASRRIIDALQYAPGNTICRVECGVVVDKHEDKFVCRERTILWRINGDKLLKLFARKCALDVSHLWDMPKIVEKYLTTGDEDIRAAARDAAGAAAGDAARDAAGAAARDAAGAAAGDAARSAARSAAAAWARAAAWAAATAWDGAWDGARDGARDAARYAARARQNRRLTAMVMAEYRRQK